MLAHINPRHHGVQNDKRKWDYSAKTHYEEFLDQYRDILSEEMIDRLKRSVNAALTGFKSHHRPEWLHAVGYTLTSMKENPQVADNLGANPKWANTQMMILEKIAKWFAMNRPESRMHIKPLFEMLLDSDIIHKLYFEVDVNYNNDYLRMFMDIHPFKKWPLFPKAYDMAFTTYYAHEKLSHATPLSQQTVTGALRKNHPASELHPSYEEISSTWATHKNQLKHAIGEEDALKEQDKTQPPCKQTKTMKDTSVHLEIERKEKLETNKVLADLDKILYGKSTVSSHASLDDSASSQLTGRKRPRTFEKSSFDPMQDDAEKDNMDEIIEELTEEPPRSTRLKRLRKR